MKRKVSELETGNAVEACNENGIIKYLCGQNSEAKQSFIQALDSDVKISPNEMMHSSIVDEFLKLKSKNSDSHDDRTPNGTKKLPETTKVYTYQRQHYDEGMHVYNDALRIDDSMPIELRFATLLYNIGLACINNKHYEEAQSWFELAIATMKKCGNFSVTVVKLQHNLGHCLYRQGKNEEAMRYYKEALVKAGKLKLGKVALAAACNCVGVLHCHSADSLTTAMKFFQISLSTYRTILGDHTKEVGTILNNMGRVHYVLSGYNEAMLMYKEALKIRCQVLGNDSIDVAATLFNMGQTYHHLGKLDKAMSLYEEFVKLVTPYLGSKNGDVAGAYKCMGKLCTDRDEIQRACSMYKLALESEKLAFGENHPKVASTLHDIGALCFKMNDTDAALKYFQEKLDIEKQLSNQKGTIISLLYIVHVYEHNGDCINALKVYKEVLLRQIKHYGYVSLEVATTLTNVGWLYSMLNSFSKSLNYRKEALHVRRDYHGSEDNLDIAKEWNSIGQIYAKLGKYELAKEAFMKSIRIRQNLLDPFHEDIAVLWFNVGTVSMAGGDDEQGMRCYKESLRIEQKIFGEDQPETSQTLQQIAEVHQSRGELDEAIWYFNKVLGIEKNKNKGGNPVSVFKLLNLIGNIHLMNSDVGEAMACYIESVRMSCQEEGGHELPPPSPLGRGLDRMYSTCAKAA